MGFLKRLIKSTFRDSHTHQHSSSFENLSDDQVETHLNISRYGNFILTNAVRPSYDLQVVPSPGYRHDVYLDQETGVEIPVLMASASKENILDLFFDLMDPIGHEVDIVLETSHERTHGGHDDMYREHIDLPVLKSVLYEYEDLLLNDGCAGVSVLNSGIPRELQFDEHKLLIMYGHELEEFEEILAQYNIECNEEIKFITEAEHVHSSREEHLQRFSELKYRLGFDT